MEKMTNVKALEAVLAYAEAHTDAFAREVVEKVEAIKDSYAKKSSSRKPTKRQEANVTLKESILDVLAGKGGLTATQVLEALTGFEDLTLPRITAQLTALKKEGAVVRFVDGKKALFKVAEDGTDVTDVEEA